MIVCYSVNDNYFDLFEVSLKSLLDFNVINKIYVLNSNLSDKYIQKTKAICNTLCEIEFIRIDINLFKNIEINYLSAETYYRLLLPKLINDDKVWYIDVDTIVLGSINQPYYQNLDFMVAAVPKPSQDDLETKKIKLKMSKDAEYFNAGVLLLNLLKLRQTNFFTEVMDWIDNNINIIELADQDALNAMLNGNYLKLDIRYNVTIGLAHIISNPLIIHFNGEFKPNLFLYKHPYKKIFLRYFSYNKNSFDVKDNSRYLKSLISLYIRRIAAKIPCIRKIYRLVHTKKI
jgi:lipopolysaccharide biosynthesis glycosyltransferase